MNTCHPSPTVTCALAIVRDCTELAPASRAVAASVFVVTDDTVSTSFDVRTAVVPPALSRVEAMKHIANLVPNCATVLVRPPRLPRGLVRNLAAGGSMPAPTTAQVLTALRPDCDVQLTVVPEMAMTTVARFFSLTRASRDDVIGERVRRVEDEAQALFLASVFCRPDQRERAKLAAAFQAWQALQRARPLTPFGPAEAF
ncbi:hypothetical protein [Erythrobacter sp. R86502]|uniref:hypothetical protein n=1 Tax=Erythrobacter sp. R86502 TaxID=3093846 RepID=UPI0036D32FB9